MIVTAKTMAKTKVPATYWKLHRRWDKERGLDNWNLKNTDGAMKIQKNINDY